MQDLTFEDHYVWKNHGSSEKTGESTARQSESVHGCFQDVVPSRYPAGPRKHSRPVVESREEQVGEGLLPSGNLT